MDDIYDNLENYNEVNLVQELKSENQELKTKLETCYSAMDRLQKFILQDFDKMAAEFKKLEMNYSSLLKTAKAEIERKTQTIKSLNMEKDILILNSAQNTRQSKFQVQKEAAMRLRNNSDSESVLSKQASKEKSHVQRLPEKSVPSEDKISSFDGNNKSKVGTERPDKTKNIESATDTPQTKALGIANRRKSMPVLSKEYSKLSSDEEYDDSGGTSNEKRFSGKNFGRSNIDKVKRQNEDKKRDKGFGNYYDRGFGNSYDRGFGNSYDRYDNYESREGGYRHRNNQYDRDRFRKAEEPEHRQRYKYYSPKRSNRRDSRDVHDSKHRKSDYGRERERVASPVSNRYNRKRSRDRHSNHDRDVLDNYERDVYENYEKDVFENYKGEVRENYERDTKENFDQNQEPHEENKWRKDKSNTDFEEPQSKRRKISISEKVCNEDLQTDTKQLISCESPDYISADNVSAMLPVKEIMDTAATKLDDPRFASEKYMKVKSGDNIMLSTVIGRNIALKIVNNATWDRINIPRPLLCLAPQFTEQFVKEIDNLCCEPGEILEANDECSNLPLKKFQTDFEIKTKSHSAEISALQGVNNDAENMEPFNKTCFQRYKISKIQRSEYSITEEEGCTNETIHKKTATLDNHLHNNVRERTSSQNSLYDVTSDENIGIYRGDLDNISKSLSNREMVQNDLELSDDNVQPLNEITKEKSKKGSSLNKKKDKVKKTHKRKKSKKDDKANLEMPVLEEMKTKFSDLFGDNSSLITPEDLQVATSEAQGQSPGQLGKLNINVTKAKSDICNMPTETEYTTLSNIDTENPISSKPNVEVISFMIDSSSQGSIKSEEFSEGNKQSNANSAKTNTRLNQVNILEVCDQKKYKAQNDLSKRNKKNSIKSAEIVDANKNDIDSKGLKELAVIKKVALKSSKIENETTKKKIGMESKSKVKKESKNTHLGDENTLPPKSLEVYVISEEKSNIALNEVKTDANLIKPVVNLDPTEVEGMNSILVSSEMSNKDKNEEINCNAAVNDEPGVKTVIISTGFQELITENTETNLECKISRAQNDLTTVLRIKDHSIKALATSTPQKECQENLPHGDKIQEAVSSFNTCPPSDNTATIVTDTNIDVPDVRIFVKRRRRVLKKP